MAVVDRADDLHTAIGRISWRAAAGSRNLHTATVQRFDREMDDWWDKPDFLDFDVDTVVRHATRVLDLPPDLAPHWRDLPNAPYDPDPAPESEPRDPDRQINWPPTLDDAAAGATTPDVPVENSA